MLGFMKHYPEQGYDYHLVGKLYVAPTCSTFYRQFLGNMDTAGSESLLSNHWIDNPFFFTAIHLGSQKPGTLSGPTIGIFGTHHMGVGPVFLQNDVGHIIFQARSPRSDDPLFRQRFGASDS